MKKIVHLVCFIFFGLIQQLFGYMPSQVRAVQKRLQTPGAKINCSGCDFRGVQEFAGLDLSNVFMPGIAMQPCVISDTNKDSMMMCIEKQAANLIGTNLSHAVLFSSCLDGIILDKADLTGADLSNCSVQYATLQDAIVKDIVTDHAIFCHTTMPDGTECKDSWTGQGVTIACNCPDEKPSATPSVQTEESVTK
jgi:hypothetical protein